jgi:hypothetical protein
VSPFQLQQWLGHANLNTTQIYVHLGKQNAKKIMEQTSLTWDSETTDNTNTSSRAHHERFCKQSLIILPSFRQVCCHWRQYGKR